MAENKIDVRGYQFDHRLENIQTLDERAMRGELHISAVSNRSYAYVSDSRRRAEVCRLRLGRYFFFSSFFDGFPPRPRTLSPSRILS
jgi:hypothetical protein